MAPTQLEKRLELQEILEGCMPVDEKNVYFQPKASFQMEYPCIVYQRDYAVTRHADNQPYTSVQRYQVTAIDKDPDSEIHANVGRLSLSLFQRHYVSANLNHDVYSVYF